MTATRTWGKDNCYICQKCGYKHWTRDVHEGFTPFIIMCQYVGKEAPDGCDGEAYSSMYRNPPVPDSMIEFEWYRPSEEELAGKDHSVIEHVRQGGLLKRRIRPINESKRRLRFA